MRSITKWDIGGMLTIAQHNLLSFRNFNFPRNKTRPLVRTVTIMADSADFPHEHHQYLPGSNFITAGMRDATTGFSLPHFIIPDLLLHGRNKEPHRHIFLKQLCQEVERQT